MPYDRLNLVTGPECPECGCADSEVLSSRPAVSGREEEMQLWTIERRQCRHCGCQFGNRAAREAEAETERGPVMHAPATCPKCRSRRVPVRSTQTMDGLVRRYHKCKDCGLKFKSIETLEDRDVRPPSPWRKGSRSNH